jgi:hypothetical protein
MDQYKIKKLLQFDTAGWIATSGLLLCVISGILLAVPYDFTKAHQSVAEILLFNPAGTFIRNFHYWSSQIFFIFTILHIYDHLKKSTETNIRKRRTWLILCIVIITLGYEMISGFILKGDAGGIQARRIVSSLLESIPFAGTMLSTLLTGTEDNWQTIYVQHVATGTILLFIGSYEHVKNVWPRLKTFMVVFTLILLVSLVLRAPLGQAESSQIKGPWFFVGIQELLHLTSYPGYVILVLGLLLILFYFLPVMANKSRLILKWFLLISGILYLAMTFFVMFFRGENWQWQSWKGRDYTDEPVMIFDPVNLLGEHLMTSIPRNQKTEGCLLCHNSMKGLSEFHNPATIGCFVCHKGNPYSSNKSEAHRNMLLIPGNFSNVRQTCGTQYCHLEIQGRMMNSLMTTQNGITVVDKFVFNETLSLNDTLNVKDLGHSAADSHLRNLCSGCHLGNDKLIVGNASWLERGGGCNACHLHYNDKALASLKRMQSDPSISGDEVHPSIDIQVPNDRCRSCHSRSGRISLSYEGWHETNLTSSEVNDSIHYRVLPDERVVEYIQADIHHLKGMACIDCHGSYEIMGDGSHHVHKEEAVNIQCVDCHPTGKPNSMVVSKLPDSESQMIAALRKCGPEKRVIITVKGQNPLMNTFVDSLNKISLKDKLSGKLHVPKVPSPVCSMGEGHKRLSCESCHTAWVPICIGCHNSYEKDTKGFDYLTNKPTKGSWVEYSGKGFAMAPALGISEKTDSKVVTAMPGMVMTIDHESFQNGRGTSFHRLYAPASGHTTLREGRKCKSCHNNPFALGYGDGVLTYSILGGAGKWEFSPRFELNRHDSLPEDSWTGFLKEAKSPNSTRTGLRPFNVKEQKRILEVGSCLTCHNENSKVTVRLLEDFTKTVLMRKKQCVVPSW